jgi:hypothetical protein
MCNSLHGKVKKIKPSGIGYKIFSCRTFGSRRVLTPMYSNHIYYKTKWNRWNKKINKYDDGFCFFSTKAGAVSYMQNNRYLVIYKIKYSKGLGKIIHQTPCEFTTFSLCKSFKLLKGVHGQNV